MKKNKRANNLNKILVSHSSRHSDNIKLSSNLIGPTLSTSKSILSQNTIKFNSLSPKPTFKKNKNNLSDIRKTLSINFDILTNFIKQNTSINTLLNKDKEILLLIKKVQNTYKNKFTLISKLKDYKSKLLIETQINYEKKRKYYENMDAYKEKVKGNEEALDAKEEYIKVLAKKLKEVEIYIHRITSDMKNVKQRKIYQQFTINEFLESLDVNAKEKEKLKKEINKLKENIKIEKNNNEEYKLQNYKNLNSNNYNLNNNNYKNNDKIQNYILQYKNNIKNIILRINYLKNNYNILTKRCQLFHINYLYRKKNNFIIENENKINLKKISKEIKDESEEESKKSILDLKKVNSYMDFSSILNNKTEGSQIDITKTGNNFECNITTNIWDISEINKKDI